MTDEIEYYKRTREVIPPQVKEPFGMDLFDPETVKDQPNVYVVKDCDVCGRKFAHYRYKGRLYRNCCEKCTLFWKKFSPLKSMKMSLFYFRVKVKRDIDEDIGGVQYFSYSPLEMDILMHLKAREKGMNVDTMMDKVYGERAESKRVLILRSCKKLIDKGKVRKYKSFHSTGVGRPRVFYNTVKEIVVLTKKCPNCTNNVYELLKEKEAIQCVYCSLKWKVGD